MLSALYRLFQRLKFSIASKGKVSLRAHIYGDLKRIELGSNVVIERGATLSTRYGGSIRIGNNSIVRSAAIVSTHGGDISIGNNSGLNHYSVVYGHGGLSIGSYVWIAAGSVVIPANHGFKMNQGPIYQQPLSKTGIVIEDDVWIGANATILDGSIVREGSIIGAGSVGKLDTVENGIYAGNPSKLVKLRDES
mgnify:FL=1